MKVSESVIPHQTLFQHQHGYVQHLTWKTLHTKSDKRHIWFWNLSKYKPYEQNVGDMAYYCISPPSKNVGTCPPCPPTKLRPWLQTDVIKTLHILHPKDNAPCSWASEGGWEDQGPHIFLYFTLKKVDFLVWNVSNEISPFLAISGKIPQLASSGKNPSDTRIATAGTIMRFVGSNGQVYYNNCPRGGQVFPTKGHIENLFATRGRI